MRTHEHPKSGRVDQLHAGQVHDEVADATVDRVGKGKTNVCHRRRSESPRDRKMAAGMENADLHRASLSVTCCQGIDE